MIDNAQLTDSVLRLKSIMEQDDYKGYDPYDGLLSPLFRLPVLRSNHTVRFLAQQAIKRSPVNLRPLLRIPKGENPVTIGLVILAHIHLKKAGVINDFKHTEALVRRIAGIRSKGQSYSCWGYDFPWAAKHADIPAHGPTVVATGIITNALFLFWKETGCTHSEQMLESACEFVIKALNRTDVESGGFIFSYSPYDQEAVLNASMKAIRLLSQGHAINQDRGYAELAQTALQPILHAQRPDGSWPYSLRSRGHWTDNYHTGYVLDGIDDYIRNTGDEKPKHNLQNGLTFYLDHFIGRDGQPHLYNNRKLPADCTAGGQTLLTLTRFGEFEKARSVADWMIVNMQNRTGFFHYRKYRCTTNKTNFMRWSNAWMLAGLSSVLNTGITKGGCS